MTCLFALLQESRIYTKYNGQLLQGFETKNYPDQAHATKGEKRHWRTLFWKPDIQFGECCIKPHTAWWQHDMGSGKWEWRKIKSEDEEHLEINWETGNKRLGKCHPFFLYTTSSSPNPQLPCSRIFWALYLKNAFLSFTQTCRIRLRRHHHSWLPCVWNREGHHLSLWKLTTHSILGPQHISLIASK